MFFSQNDPAWAGISQLFNSLQTRLEVMIRSDSRMQTDAPMHLQEIHEYIIFQLHGEFFLNKQASRQEADFQKQITAMQTLEPSQYGPGNSRFQGSSEMKFAFHQAIKQVKKIAEQKTPR